MKKIAIVLACSLTIGISATDNQLEPNPFLAPKTEVIVEQPLESPSTEKENDTDLDEADLKEYDQQVCDSAKQAPVSQAQALLTKLGTTLFIQYYLIKDKIEFYYEQLKQRISALLANKKNNNENSNQSN